MKKIFLYVFLVFCLSCQKTIVNEGPQQIEEDFTTSDGCNGTCYIYDGTPVAGDNNYAYSLVNFTQVETVVKTIHADSSVSILSAKLVDPFSSVYDQVYAIYYWITLNMRYDYVMLEGQYHCNWQNSATVLHRKLGVCEGLSNLFVSLCKSANIGAVKVWGTTIDGSGHSWNAVQIQGEWYLLDVTWDLMFKTKGRTYFFADPKTFYMQHIPDTQFLKWKLFGFSYKLCIYRPV